MAGINGSKISHSASVRSEGYAFRSLISSSPLLVLFTYASPFLYRLNHLKLTLSYSGISRQNYWKQRECHILTRGRQTLGRRSLRLSLRRTVPVTGCRRGSQNL